MRYGLGISINIIIKLTKVVVTLYIKYALPFNLYAFISERLVEIFHS